MTTERHDVLTTLQVEFDRWQALLAQVPAGEIEGSRLRNGWSIKDLMAHLMAWQQVTVARLQAAARRQAPALPSWLEGDDPETEEFIHRFNATIFALHHDRPWAQIYGEWKAGFGTILRLAAELPEDDLLEPGRYPWLHGHPLVAVLHGTYDHHHTDHLGYLLDWLAEARD